MLIDFTILKDYFSANSFNQPAHLAFKYILPYTVFAGDNISYHLGFCDK